MTNLTQSQQSIVDTLVSEFASLNKSSNVSDNIFLSLYDEAMADKIRIKEIEAMNKANRDAINLQIETDRQKYEQMFEDLSIQLSRRYDGNSHWELSSFDGKVCARDHHGYNKLYWQYVVNQKSEYVLGQHRDYACGHYITFSGFRDIQYTSIEQVFESDLFKTYLKELISKLN